MYWMSFEKDENGSEKMEKRLEKKELKKIDG